MGSDGCKEANRLRDESKWHDAGSFVNGWEVEDRVRIVFEVGLMVRRVVDNANMVLGVGSGSG